MYCIVCYFRGHFISRLQRNGNFNGFEFHDHDGLGAFQLELHEYVAGFQIRVREFVAKIDSRE